MENNLYCEIAKNQPSFSWTILQLYTSMTVWIADSFLAQWNPVFLLEEARNAK